jgi:LysR family nitrogen assimilation transcriptional regulator
METRRLQYFIQIIDAGSISRAAVAIGIAQPALSQQLAILENELKVRLVNRSPAGVTPTDAGRRLYQRGQVILRQVGSLKLELGQTTETVAGVVAIGLPPSLGASIGGELLRRVRLAFPQIHLQVIEDGASNLTKALQSGVLDLAISPLRVSDPALDGEALLEEELFLVSSPSLGAIPQGMDQIAKLPWIVTASPNAIRGYLNTTFAQADLQPNIVAEINSLPIVIGAVRDGLGVTLLPRAVISEELADGSIVASAFADPPPKRVVHLYQRLDYLLTPAQAVVRQLIIEIGIALKGRPDL